MILSIVRGQKGHYVRYCNKCTKKDMNFVHILPPSIEKTRVFSIDMGDMKRSHSDIRQHAHILNDNLCNMPEIPGRGSVQVPRRPK